MIEMQISKFKATCLSVLDRVAKTGEPVLVTRLGKPLARILPLPPGSAGDWLGAMEGSGEIHDDLIAPATESSDWEVLG